MLKSRITPAPPKPVDRAETLFATRATQIMSMAANADGKTDAHEIDVIRDLLAQITGKQVPSHEIAQIVAAVSMPQTDAEYSRLGTGVTQDHRELLIKAALMVVAADGDISTGESHFMARLYDGLGMTQAGFDALVTATFSEQRPAE